MELQRIQSRVYQESKAHVARHENNRLYDQIHREAPGNAGDTQDPNRDEKVVEGGESPKAAGEYSSTSQGCWTEVKKWPASN
jgi:hypothetical protein